MRCRDLRKRLSESAGPTAQVAETVRQHLEICTDCSEFAERLEQARSALRSHHAAAEPDAQFSARVLERVRDERTADPLDDLGWAALRLLPAAVVLVAFVSWSALQPSPGLVSLLVPGAGDDVLTAFVVSGLNDTRQPPSETRP